MRSMRRLMPLPWFIPDISRRDPTRTTCARGVERGDSLVRSMTGCVVAVGRAVVSLVMSVAGRGARRIVVFVVVFVVGFVVVVVSVEEEEPIPLPLS